MKRGIYSTKTNKFYWLFYSKAAPANELNTLVSKLLARDLLPISQKDRHHTGEIMSLDDARKQNIDIEVVFYLPRDKIAYASQKEEPIEW